MRILAWEEEEDIVSEQEEPFLLNHPRHQMSPISDQPSSNFELNQDKKAHDDDDDDYKVDVHVPETAHQISKGFETKHPPTFDGFFHSFFE